MKSNSKEDLLQQTETNTVKFRMIQEHAGTTLGLVNPGAFLPLVIPEGLHECLTACSSPPEKHCQVASMQLLSFSSISSSITFSSSSWMFTAASRKLSTQESTFPTVSSMSRKPPRASSTHLIFFSNHLPFHF